MSEPLEEVSPLVNPATRHRPLRRYIGIESVPAIEAASQFQASMSKLQALSIPENRTQEDFRLFGQALLAGTQCIGTQPDENGVEHEVWQHTFTPPDAEWWVDHLPASPKRWGEVDPFFDNPRINCALARLAEQSMKQHRAEERARKRTRRQRRVAQRRHNRGVR